MPHSQPRDRRRLRPLNRKDWPSFSEDEYILNEYSYEEFHKLSPRKQYKKELALMGKLYGCPYENCRSIISPLLYDEGDREKPTYLCKLMHKCWKMGAFDPCRLYLQDRQEIYDVDMTDKDYSSYDTEEEYDDSGSESEYNKQEGWSYDIHHLRSGNEKEVKRGVGGPNMRKHTSRQKPVKKEFDIREEDDSPGSKGFTKSSGARESLPESSKLLNSGASSANKKTSKSITKARNSVGPTSSGKESSKPSSPSPIPTQDPAHSKSKKRTAKTTPSTTSPSRPQTPVPSKREPTSPSGSRSSKVEKASEPISGKPQRVKKPNITHRVQESREVDPAVDSKVAKVSSKKRSQVPGVPEICESRLSSNPSTKISIACEGGKDNEHVKREKNRKVSLSATSNSAPKPKRDRDVKPLTKSSHEREVDSPNGSSFNNSSHSFVKKSYDAASIQKDAKPQSAIAGVNGLDGLDILGSFDLKLPEPLNLTEEHAKAGTVPGRVGPEELAPDPRTAYSPCSDAVQAKRDRKIKPLPKSRRARITEEQIDSCIKGHYPSLIEGFIAAAPIQKDAKSYSETIAVSKPDEEGNIGPPDRNLALPIPFNGELTKASPALEESELDNILPVLSMAENSTLKAQLSSTEAHLSAGQDTQRPSADIAPNDHEEYDLTTLLNSSGDRGRIRSINETQEHQNLVAQETAIYSSSGIDDIPEIKVLTWHESLQSEDQASMESLKELDTFASSLLVSEDVRSGIFETKQANHTQALVPFVPLFTICPLTARRVSDIGLKKHIASYFFE